MRGRMPGHSRSILVVLAFAVGCADEPSQQPADAAAMYRAAFFDRTPADMAQIIGVAEATVNFHMPNACVKLGTPNKTAAAVQAAMLGLLW